MKLLLARSHDELLQILKKTIKKCIDDCDPKTITVGLSGGSLISILASILPQIQTDLKKWKFFFCDERLVPFENDQSIFGEYFKQFSGQLNISRHQFVTINPDLCGNECALDYANQIKNNVLIKEENQLPCFDLLFLGMGPDGHTCSLFPNHALLKEKFLWVGYVNDSPKFPPRRITMTYPVLNNTKNVIFVVTGETKAKAVKDVLTTKNELPATLVQPKNGKLYWIIDEGAASLLSKDMFLDKTI